MRRIATVSLFFAGLLLSLSAPLWGRQQQDAKTIFQSSADAVFVDVSVMNGRRPVGGLSAADFNMVDNGKAQVVDEAVIEPKALDVTVLLDQSGSVGPFEAGVLVPGAHEISGVLQADDHVELVTFDRQLRRVVSSGTPRDVLSPPRIGDGGTALFDAIAAALMEHTDPGHRHLIVALTDGIDTQSVISRERCQAIIARSNAVVYIVAVSIAGRTSNFFGNTGVGRPLESAGDYDYLLREITDNSSGQFYDLRPGVSFISSFRDAVEAFRQRYTLRYRPVDVETAGWHELKVTLKRGKYEVHARKGYFGGS